ncbi:hypothetical protein N836_31675 [Leptolyngbya sp. Heron Island J]|nr:hypothetical protein N836_31675 [Leptolyngbya sp. Heron Island J]
MQAASVRAFNGEQAMKLHSINIIIPTIVFGVTLLGLAVLWRGGSFAIRSSSPDSSHEIEIIGPEKEVTQ